MDPQPETAAPSPAYFKGNRFWGSRLLVNTPASAVSYSMSETVETVSSHGG
jgi:hypothetical protein